MQETAPTRGARSHGSSGAVIDVREIDVVKYGNSRVAEQGQFLTTLNPKVVPAVYHVDFDASLYVMERLHTLPHKVVEQTWLTIVVLQMLDNMAIKRPSIEFDMDAHIEKMLPLCPTPSFVAKVVEVSHAINWGQLDRVVTHGDPTHENLMMRTNGDLVLTDPIPATPAVPHLRCVDLGKMLQSAMGFEQMRYGVEEYGSWTYDVSTILKDITSIEIRAAWYWCAVHFLRAAPYMPDDTTKEAMISGAYAALRRV